ncbi:MAG: helix-turn-helix transcriptional regulator [Planctomycetota bacterium]
MTKQFPPLTPSLILRTFFLVKGQTELADLTGLSCPTVCRLLSGKTHVTWSTAVKLARGLHTRPETWIELQAEADAAERESHGEA